MTQAELIQDRAAQAAWAALPAVWVLSQSEKQTEDLWSL